MRYRGQSYEVSVPVAKLRDAADVAALMRRFHEAHRRRYGHMAQNEAVEIVNFQVTAIGRFAKPKFKRLAHGRRRRASVRPANAARLFRREPSRSTCRSIRRDALAPGGTLAGPAVIEEKTSTIVIYPGQRACVDEYLNLEIETADVVPAKAGTQEHGPYD